MWTRRTRPLASAALLAVVLALLVTRLVLAGGWATVTLDDLPRAPRAGETLALGLTIRQHGFREVDLDIDANPVFLFAENPVTGETVQFDAIKDGNTGHFLVDVTFPSAGQWNWGVQPGWFPKVNYEPLTVLPAATPASSAFASLQALFHASLRPWRDVLLPALPQLNATEPGAGDTAAPAAVDQALYGRSLFVAKGCTGCHMHEELSDVVHGPVIGPNLTHREMDPQFLRQWLADPSAVRTGTQMPNLGLDSDEIDALVVFLTHG